MKTLMERQPVGSETESTDRVNRGTESSEETCRTIIVDAAKMFLEVTRDVVNASGRFAAGAVKQVLSVR